ncbi:MAG: hypothetical protein ABJA67_06730 [Chthonomonadales bacterium]
MPYGAKGDFERVTCIACWIKDGKTYMGGDRKGSGRGIGTIRADVKVFEKTAPHSDHSFVFGFCGSYRMGQIIKHHVELPEIDNSLTHDKWEKWLVTDFIPKLRNELKSHGYTTIDKNTETGGLFLIGHRGFQARIDSDFQAGIIADGFVSCGSGEEFAYGAYAALLETGQSELMPGDELVKVCISAAAKYNHFVGGGVDVLVS